MPVIWGEQYYLNNDSIPFIRKGKSYVLQERDYRNADGSRLPVLYFPALEQGGAVKHFYTTRFGGVSEGYLSSLNFGFNRGDDPAHVMENYRRVAKAFGTDIGHLVLSHQTHGTIVRRAEPEDAGVGLTQSMEGHPGWESVDGLVTNVPGLVLGIFTADCVPVLFADPVHRAVGACHSGWRGTVGRICARTVQKMEQEFGTDPGDLVVDIGPSICQEHYEVSEEVADCFRREFPGHEGEILGYAGNPGHQQLDLWEACRITLMDAGVPAEQISVTDICTACNPDLLFSHRASHGKRGNIGAFIELVP